MDASRLRETLDLLLHREAEVNMQGRLTDLVNSLSQLVSNPQQPQFQTSVSAALDQLRSANAAMRVGFEPSQVETLEQIGARPFFLDDLPEEIATLVQLNPMSPAVVHQRVNQIVADRQAYLTTISELRDRLQLVGVFASKLQPGDAEVGFRIPRELFDDNLDGLIGELREIRFIIRSFAEVATGAAEPIIVREISTTDPLFFFGMTASTVAMIGRATCWVLETWKQVEEIRKLRVETQRLGIAREKDLLDILDKSVTEKIEATIKARVRELVPDESDGRPKELQTHMTLALQSMFARVERGMSIEIRFLPPSVAAETEVTASPTSMSFATLAEIAPNLAFPPTLGTPILHLPRPAQQRTEP
jgi:hypothetical protein